MRTIILICFTLLSITTIGQPKNVTVLYNNDPYHKTLQTDLYDEKTYPAYVKGSCFFVKYKEKYYLVSCYHVFTSRSFEDTTLFINITKEENKITTVNIFNKEYGITSTGLTLKTDNNKRRYFSFPVSTKTKRQIIDIAILPADSIGFAPSSEIHPIDLSKVNSKYKIKKGSKLYCYGFSKRKRMNDTFPFCDTLKVVGDQDFDELSRYILIDDPLKMGGSSGSPVYMEDKKPETLVGILFASIPREVQPNYPEIFNGNYYLQPIGVLVSVGNLRKLLESFAGK